MDISCLIFYQLVKMLNKLALCQYGLMSYAKSNLGQNEPHSGSDFLLSYGSSTFSVGRERYN